MSAHETSSLLHTEREQMKKFREIVAESIREERLVMDSLVNKPDEFLSRGQRVSDRVARFGGSWKFIFSFLLLMMIWILINLVGSVRNHFDPYPFILMNLLLSCIAALQAPIIMMSQNRQEEKDRKRAENDYLVNLKAEIEVRNLHRKVDLLLEEQIKTLFDVQAQQLNILKKIEDRLDSNLKS